MFNVLIFLTWLAIATVAVTANGGERGVTFTILSITDNYKLQGNITRIPAAKLAENADVIANTGDIFSPHAEGYVDHGRSALKIVEAANASISIVGNHDLDYGLAEFCRVIQDTGDGMAWVLSNLKHNCSGPVQVHEYTVVHHEGKRIAFIGLLSNNMEIYNKKRDVFEGAVLEDPIATAARLDTHIKANDIADTMVILSHMSKADEIRLAQSGNYTVIVSGHDVDYFVGQVNGCWILKAGENVNKYGLIKLTWPHGDDAQPTVTAELMDTIVHEQDPELIRIAQQEHDKVAQSEMGRAVLGKIPAMDGPMTTRTLRKEQSSVIGWLLAQLVCALPGSHGAMFCSGNLRGSEDYCPNQDFTFFDLLVIQPYLDANVVRVHLPGAFIAELVSFSRSLAPESHARYMQLDSGMRWDEATNTLTHIANAPLEPERLYTMVISEQLLLGLDLAAVEEYVAQHPEARDTTLGAVDIRDVLRAHMMGQERTPVVDVAAEANASAEATCTAGAAVTASVDVSASGETREL